MQELLAHVPLEEVPSADGAKGAGDRALVRRLLARDESAFRELVARDHAALVRIAGALVNPATAEEIAQDTWARVLENLPRFEGRSSLRTWIIRICLNRAKAIAVREARSTPFGSFGSDDGGEVEAERFDARGNWIDPPRAWRDRSAEAVLLRREALECLGRELCAMSATQRAVLTLRDLEGLDSREVCNALQLTESNQRVVLHRARTRVRRALEKMYRQEGK
jgi:RNA polymerase sigma-70 factor (ECF subfamily)